MPISKNVYLKICIKFKNIYIKICFGACIWTQVRIFCSIKIVCQRKGCIVFLLSISCIFCCRFEMRLRVSRLTILSHTLAVFPSIPICVLKGLSLSSVFYAWKRSCDCCSGFWIRFLSCRCIFSCLFGWLSWWPLIGILSFVLGTRRRAGNRPFSYNCKFSSVTC